MIAWGGYNWILGSLLLMTFSLFAFIIVEFQIFLILSIIILIIICFLLVFFRDPNRYPGHGIVSPADGRVILIKSYQEKSKQKSMLRIAIFMSVLNVHVNRTPISGQVIYMKHKTGSFVPAYKTESMNNEQLITILKSKLGIIRIIQIAGILAKRIVPYIRPGQLLKKGQRIGIIQFGSRVDLILPKKNIYVCIKAGQNVKAGITTIAKIKN